MTSPSLRRGRRAVWWSVLVLTLALGLVSASTAALGAPATPIPRLTVSSGPAGTGGAVVQPTPCPAPGADFYGEIRAEVRDVRGTVWSRAAGLGLLDRQGWTVDSLGDAPARHVLFEVPAAGEPGAGPSERNDPPPGLYSVVLICEKYRPSANPVTVTTKTYPSAPFFVSGASPQLNAASSVVAGSSLRVSPKQPCQVTPGAAAVVETVLFPLIDAAPLRADKVSVPRNGLWGPTAIAVPASRPAATFRLTATCGPRSFALRTTYRSTRVTVTAPTKPTDSPKPPSATRNYVSLGDSFSSGEGNAPFDGDTDTPWWVRDKNTCHRSSAAWPRIAGIEQGQHLACSGAVMADFHRGQMLIGADTSGQIDRLSVIERGLERKGQSLDAVTVTIGGNDSEVAFADTLKACFLQEYCLEYEMGGVDGRLARLGDRLVGELGAVKRAATPGNVSGNNAKLKVVLVGYPRLFPKSDSDNQCRPFEVFGVPVVNNGWLQSAERERLNTIATKLDATYRNAAARAGVTFVSTLDTLGGHELCTKDSWVVPIVSGQRGAWFVDQQQGHPRRPWQDKVAGLVRAQLP